MSKKLKNLKWDSVPLDGFPVSMSNNFQGFVGLEECTEYGLDVESKKKNKTKSKRKNKSETIKEVPSKKVKLSNGFIVESILPNIQNSSKQDKIKSKNDKDDKKKTLSNKENISKKSVLRLGEKSITESVLTPEDMLTWAEFKLPEDILKALAELGFKKPTKIQQLTLPAAIHGRRDILGAAETGSGKTLAFGLPILTGIIKLKEKAAKGFDIYELPYKKASAKKKNKVNEQDKRVKKKQQKKKFVKEAKSNESSEEGYGSGKESDHENEDSDSEKSSAEENEKNSPNEEYVKEIVVPFKKQSETVENNDSDDDNYINLSEMLDSDDLAETSDDEATNNDDSGSVKDKVESQEVDWNDQEISEDEAECEEEEESNEQGIGCVKVIDNVEMPGHVVTKTGKPLYALILTPTRELAVQISQHLKAVAKYTGIRIATIVGGMAAVKQERVLASSPEIVVATPGRLWELITSGQPHLSQLDSVKFLAIDETDRMIERGHFEELRELLTRLNADETRARARQNFVFSATLTFVHQLPRHVTQNKVTKRGKIIKKRVERMTAQQRINRLVELTGMSDPKVVDITTENLGTAETLTECRIACSFEDKDAYLYYILRRHPGRTIVFCNSIGSVKRLAQLLTLLKCRPLPLHANMIQKQRLKNLERFRDDPRGVLVATDVAARGLDIPDVDHVIHYQVPRTAENYVHRSGRTARANKEGLTILMMEPSEASRYGKLCQTLNKTSELETFPVPSYLLSPMKEAVVLAREIDALALRRKRSAQEVGWKEKAAREMDIIIDDDDLPVKEVDPSIDKALHIKKKRLEALMSRPMFPKGFSYKYPTLNDPDALLIKDENALQVMKKAIESGELKKNKRKSKNAPLLKLEKQLRKIQTK